MPGNLRMDKIKKNVILTQGQKELLLFFTQSTLSEIYYLSGGTALSACYLGHRFSEDLDFFTDQDIDIEHILLFLRSIPAIREITYERKYDRKIFLLEYPSKAFLKAEFTRYPFERLAPFLEFDGLLVDSLQDILSNKLMAMTDRRDPKDYVDIFSILQAYPSIQIENAIGEVEKKFGVKGVGSILAGRFLEPPVCEGIPLTREINPSQIQLFFKEMARSLIRRSLGE